VSHNQPRLYFYRRTHSATSKAEHEATRPKNRRSPGCRCVCRNLGLLKVLLSQDRAAAAGCSSRGAGLRPVVLPAH
jgi:hypothetical protein